LKRKFALTKRKFRFLGKSWCKPANGDFVFFPPHKLQRPTVGFFRPEKSKSGDSAHHLAAALSSSKLDFEKFLTDFVELLSFLLRID
jgi:hypothetical protein